MNWGERGTNRERVGGWMEAWANGSRKAGKVRKKAQVGTEDSEGHGGPPGPARGGGDSEIGRLTGRRRSGGGEGGARGGEGGGGA